MSLNFTRSRDLQIQMCVSKTTIWRWVRQGRLPKPTRLSPGVVGWPTSQLEQWLQSHAPEAGGCDAMPMQSGDGQ